jgi:hypothetical protein
VTPEDIGAGLSVGFLLVFWLAMMALNIAIYVFYVWSLVDIAKTPPELFEWPGERVKSPVARRHRHRLHHPVRVLRHPVHVVGAGPQAAPAGAAGDQAVLGPDGHTAGRLPAAPARVAAGSAPGAPDRASVHLCPS